MMKEHMVVRHTLPQRIRLTIPALRDEKAARSLEQWARGVEGIHWVRINPRCAGVVVRFDENRFSETELIELFRQHAG